MLWNWNCWVKETRLRMVQQVSLNFYVVVRLQTLKAFTALFFASVMCSSKTCAQQARNEKYKKAKENNQPLSFRDLLNHLLRAEYQKAIIKKMNFIEQKGILTTVFFPTGLHREERWNLLLFLSRKRDERFKARLVYDGQSQRYKPMSNYGLPTFLVRLYG